MASGWEKSVKGATKIKLAAPKSKYIEHILIATHTGEAGVAEVFRALQARLRDATWTVVFKGLIVVHLMMREGQEDVTLKYLSLNPRSKLAISNFTEAQTQGRNIRTYADYLAQRSASYGGTKVDYVRSGEGRLKGLSVERGLLRETESVQDQLRALFKCDFLSHEPENEITLTAFRLLILDLLSLFYVMNEGTINILEHLFELSRTDAERAVKIYKAFVKQTDAAVRFLSTARHFEHATRLEIPKIKHAPTGLSSSLEEYLNDPEFEAQRKQYLTQQESNKKGKSVNGKALGAKPSTASNGISIAKASTSQTSAKADKPQQKGPAPDLIDFFESIEQYQQPMAQPTYQQPQFGQVPPGHVQVPGGMPQQYAPQGGIPQGFGPVPVQNTNPFLQMQAAQMQAPQVQPTQMGPPQVQQNMGPVSYSGAVQQNRFATPLSSIPQSSVASFPAQGVQQLAVNAADVHSTNPFRQSMMMGSATGASNSSFGSGTTLNTAISSQAGTNPFAKSSTPSTPQMAPYSASPFSQPNSYPFSPVGSQPSPFGPVAQASPVGQNGYQIPQATALAGAGSNPFAKATAAGGPSPFAPAPGPAPYAQAPVVSQATGSTNPFRQSSFVNPSTGAGWQSSAQGTIGGMASDGVETVPVFPRPGMGQR